MNDSLYTAALLAIGAAMGIGLWVEFHPTKDNIIQAGPGEVCSCDADGRCVVTRKGRIVTRWQG